LTLIYIDFRTNNYFFKFTNKQRKTIKNAYTHCFRATSIPGLLFRELIDEPWFSCWC